MSTNETIIINDGNKPVIKGKWEVISPARAKDLLNKMQFTDRDGNEKRKNRKVRPQHAVSLRRQMEKGQYREHCADPIRIDLLGSVIDGQHRLMAVRDSQKEGVHFLVLRGYDTGDWVHFDEDKPRTLADTLGIEGVNKASAVSSTVKLLWKLSKWEKGAPQSPTNEEGLTFFNNHPMLGEAIRQGENIHKSLDIMDRLGATLWYSYHANGLSRKFEAFIAECLKDPEAEWPLINGYQNNGAYLLRVLVKAEMGTAKSRLEFKNFGSGMVAMVWIHRAFESWRNDRPLNDLRDIRGEERDVKGRNTGVILDSKERSVPYNKEWISVVSDYVSDAIAKMEEPSTT